MYVVFDRSVSFVRITHSRVTPGSKLRIKGPSPVEGTYQYGRSRTICIHCDGGELEIPLDTSVVALTPFTSPSRFSSHVHPQEWRERWLVEWEKRVETSRRLGRSTVVGIRALSRGVNPIIGRTPLKSRSVSFSTRLEASNQKYVRLEVVVHDIQTGINDL